MFRNVDNIQFVGGVSDWRQYAVHVAKPEQRD
jgi:hypothetical protein